MTRHATAEDRADRDRDLAKHDRLPHRLERQIGTALDIALLCRCLVDIQDAAALIEQYAQTVAADARLDATIKTSDRVLAVLEASNAQA